MVFVPATAAMAFKFVLLDKVRVSVALPLRESEYEVTFVDVELTLTTAVAEVAVTPRVADFNGVCPVG